VLLLELAEQGPRSQAQLAQASGCEPPTITNSVRKLEAAGLVVRDPSPTYGRVTIVELSDRRHNCFPSSQPHGSNWPNAPSPSSTTSPSSPLSTPSPSSPAALTATSAPAPNLLRYPATAPDTSDRETIPLPAPTSDGLRSCVAALLAESTAAPTVAR